ncbi:UDP-3-O-[3-hydroxymyristoyl] glucosamine N-acyltransferase [Endobacter medicaginis]|uniref:UDP-3-O-acylglucosamine N-acyltransferase n=2 Tax=Endobacter medicaginis TaxID=1181271 RepID=A0A839V0V4_9PROT|nr:UDP-3-O-(3-hydroxymyristoyl)glucosamine N-acyltransferase [Endobacter medicaginis]MBB3173252.1 UDP-3-O-[3-hydroxymyristoyl] glucosamine N-acyltransferase [Endobacter medicaginis]MCX5476364.1 UDP-3-O-(3-hydroxymyristoyl)glucosamine N-acyltransferase [Endobacter medicaginis]
MSGQGLGAARFFRRAGPFRLSELAELAGCELRAPQGAGERMFSGVAPLQAAGAQELSFLDNRRYLPVLDATRAGAVICAPAFAGRVPQGCAALVTRAPYVAWARIAAHFHPAPAVRPGVHPSAVIDEGAQVDPQAEIGAFVQVGAGAVIGAGTRIASHAAIGPGVVIGACCRIGQHVSLSHARLGDRVTLHPGARIGQEGFGFALTESGFLTVPQLGQVVIGDDVEIGANSTIDRGSATDTVIGAGSRLDNLVQIGHNVRLGRCCIVVAQAGISGSTELEDFVTVAAQAGLIGHIRIGAKARIGAQAGVMSDVASGADVIGSPAMPFREFFRNVAVLRRLARRPEASADGPAD